MNTTKSDTLGKSTVLVIGASGVDVIGIPDQPVDSLTTVPGTIHYSHGGVARNIAENLVHLGQPVTLITAVGEDDLGKSIIHHLEEEGVDTSGCHFSKEIPTGIYMAIHNASGERKMAIADRNNVSEITSSYLKQHESMFDKVGMVVLDANLQQVTIRTAIKLAHKYHVPVCADPASVTLTDRLKPFLSQLEIITPNAQEAGALLDWEDEVQSLAQTMQAARQLVETGVKTAIIPMAENGVCYASAETNGHIPSILTNVIDPTGAGDALTSVVIYAYLNGISIDDGIRLGVSAASLTLRRYGAVLPDLSLETIYESLVI